MAVVYRLQPFFIFNKMKANIVFVLFLCFTFSGFGQSDLKIDLENFDQLEMEAQVMKAIDDYRKSNKIPAVLQDEILDAASFDQAEYNQKNNKEAHSQDEVVKENVQKRVRFYKGLHYEMGELIYIATIGAPIKVMGSQESFVINTYEDAARAALNQWQKKEDTKEILDDQTYFNAGVAASFNAERREISIVSVLASAPFELKEKKDREDDYGLVEFNKTLCDLFNRKNSYLPELLSDKVFVKDGIIYLENSDRELLSEILADSRDGFAIDIVSKDQFDCNGGNKIYPSNIHYGLLLRPIKASSVNFKTPEGNYLDNIQLGEMPTYFSEKDVNLNLLVFKEGSVCNYIPQTKTMAKNLHWLEPQWEVFESNSEEAIFYHKREFKSAETEKVTTLLDSIKSANVTLSDLTISITYNDLTPLDSVQIKSDYLTKSSELVKKPKITIRNTWNEIEKFISNRSIGLDVKGVSKPEKIEALIATENEDEKAFFTSSQVTTVTYGLKEKTATKPTSSLINEYKQSVASNQIKNALIIQLDLIERAKNNDDAAKGAISVTKIEQIKENLALISNTAIAKHQLDNKKVLAARENLRRTLLGLYLVDKSNPIISYNLCLSVLYQWELSKKAPITPEKWEEYFKSASLDSTVSEEKLMRLNTNFYLLSADYYFDKGDIRERKKSLQSAYNSIMAVENSKEEMLAYAQYYMFQLQINWATTILKKQLSKAFDSEIAANLISLSAYPTSEITDAFRSELLDKIHQSDPKIFCDLFKTNAAHFLYLRDELTKKNWCSACQ